MGIGEVAIDKGQPLLSSAVAALPARVVDLYYVSPCELRTNLGELRCFIEYAIERIGLQGVLSRLRVFAYSAPGLAGLDTLFRVLGARACRIQYALERNRD